MYTINRVAIRESTETAFWDFTPEQIAAIKVKYEDTGRRTSFEVTVDDLMEVRNSVWVTKEDWEEYNTEYADCWVERDKYYADNNIVAMRSANIT